MTVKRSSGMLEGTAIDQKYIDLAAQRDVYRLVSSEVIQPCSGKGFRVDKDQVFRIVQVEGPQIGDVWLFNRDDTEILHDNFMVFQPSFIRPDGSGDSVASQSQPGDYVEFYADMDLIVAVSACPVGDYAVPISEPDNITTRPLGFEIYNTNKNKK